MNVSRFSLQLIVALILNIGLKVISFVLTTCLTRTLTPNQSATYYLYDFYPFIILFLVRGTVRSVALRHDPRERGLDRDGAAASTESAEAAPFLSPTSDHSGATACPPASPRSSTSCISRSSAASCRCLS